MNKMLSFKQKILLSYFTIIAIFFVAMYLFSSYTVKSLVNKAICERVSELIGKIEGASNEDALIQKLKDQKYLIFFRISVISYDHRVLYDSYVKRFLGKNFNTSYVVNHPEVNEAFEKGVGYHEADSKLLGQRFVYMAKAFDFHGKTYVLRTAFPYKFVSELTHDFEMGFLGMAIAVLLLFSLMTWLLVNHLTRPIQQIINAIRPYQEGHQETLPVITIGLKNTSDEFSKLADTLNSLSHRVSNQIDTLIYERNEKEAVLESLMEGVVAVNQDMVVTYANNMALKLLGIKDKSRLIGFNFRVAQQHACLGLLTACQLENQVLTDTIQLKRDGFRLYLDLVAAPTKAKSGAILVLQDKSAHHKILEMRKDFIANASHELKTPVTIVRGFAEALEDNPDLPQSTRQEIIEKIVRNSKRMGTIIKDLLALSDIENISESRLIECDIGDLLDSCCHTLRDLFPDIDVTLHQLLPEETYTVADPQLLELAFMNLLENAAKYSNPPVKIEVTLDIEDEWVKVSIADNGIGMAKSDLEHIFERFYRINKTNKTGGTGLGLAIVETIIDKHGGKISVDSEPDQGSTFTIRLPLKKLEF
jgi:two-component system phosphate regulon sensor histidine kinase PhoR